MTVVIMRSFISFPSRLNPEGHVFDGKRNRPRLRLVQPLGIYLSVGILKEASKITYRFSKPLGEPPLLAGYWRKIPPHVAIGDQHRPVDGVCVLALDWGERLCEAHSPSRGEFT
jgi:hypothetical protein